MSSNGKYLFEAVYGAGLARIYKLNPITGAIEKLIEELEHEFPTGSHERQRFITCSFLNETPDHKYVVATDLGTDRVVTYKFGEDGLKQYAVSQFKIQTGLATSLLVMMDDTRISFTSYQMR